jgi:hypothetical protein
MANIVKALIDPIAAAVVKCTPMSLSEVAVVKPTLISLIAAAVVKPTLISLTAAAVVKPMLISRILATVVRAITMASLIVAAAVNRMLTTLITAVKSTTTSMETRAPFILRDLTANNHKGTIQNPGLKKVLDRASVRLTIPQREWI